MDYEKKYKEALEKAHKLCAYPTTKPFISDLQDLFPELKESEDERIRLELIRDIDIAMPIETAQRYIAWLEKQGRESKKVSIWKHWKDGIAGNGEGKLIYLVKMNNTYNLSSCLSFECDYIELSELDNLLSEKQGNANKDFPQFTFDDVFALQCVMENVKKVQEDKDLYNKLLLLHNKIHDAYTITKR